MNFRFPKANYATHSAPLPDDHFYLPEDDQAGKHIGKGAENHYFLEGRFRQTVFVNQIVSFKKHYFFRQRYCGGGRDSLILPEI